MGVLYRLYLLLKLNIDTCAHGGTEDAAGLSPASYGSEGSNPSGRIMPL